MEEIKKLGISGVELNFNLPRKTAEEFVLLKKKGEAEIISVHNYCPLPDEVDPKKASPDYPSLAALDQAERKSAVRLTKGTIDFAARLKAKVVVLHLGRVEVKDRTVKLWRLGKNNPSYFEMKAGMIKERARRIKPHFDSVIKSLEELEPYARKEKILLGIENRYYYREIPSPDEISYILDRFGDSSIYYWHDLGHGQAQENAGLSSHQALLKSFSRKLIGIHLHDIIGIEDHRVPGTGNFDFRKLAPYMGRNIYKVIEAHQPATVDEMAKGIRFLQHVLGTGLDI